MDLVLSIVRCPDAAVPETRSFGGGEVVIGRGEDCSWKLLDPDQHLSRRHCSVAYRGGAWHVTDLSTNGTFLNRGSSPIGKGAEVPLNDGDRLTLGEYELEVRIAAGASAPKFRSARATIAWTAIAVSGAFSEGFQITLSPQTKASAAFQLQTATGKLNAEMTPTGPTGCHCSVRRCSPRSDGMQRP